MSIIKALWNGQRAPDPIHAQLPSADAVDPTTILSLDPEDVSPDEARQWGDPDSLRIYRGSSFEIVDPTVALVSQGPSDQFLAAGPPTQVYVTGDPRPRTFPLHDEPRRAWVREVWPYAAIDDTYLIGWKRVQAQTKRQDGAPEHAYTGVRGCGYRLGEPITTNGLTNFTLSPLGALADFGSLQTVLACVMRFSDLFIRDPDLDQVLESPGLTCLPVAAFDARGILPNHLLRETAPTRVANHAPSSVHIGGVSIPTCREVEVTFRNSIREVMDTAQAILADPEAHAADIESIEAHMQQLVLNELAQIPGWRDRFESARANAGSGHPDIEDAQAQGRLTVTQIPRRK